MHNDYLEKRIENQKAEIRERELFEKFRADKEREFMEHAMVIEKPLSEYSTTQLKAELRRRKRGAK